MAKKYLCSAVAVVLIAACCAIPCPASEFSEIVAFGASLTDGGNVFEISPPYFEGRHVPPTPPYYQGRFSNGPTYVDVLAEMLDVPPLLPSETGGTNYAYGAATSGLVVLDHRVTQIDEQVSQFLSANTPQPEQLFVFGLVNDFAPSIGHNDAVASAAHMRDQVQAVIDAGGRHFLIGNLLNTRAVYREYNQELHRVVGSLRSAEVSIYEVSVGGVIDHITANASEFGITNTTSPACRECGGGTNPDAIASDVVDNPDEYLLFDWLHFTAPVNRVLGEASFDATRVLLDEAFNDGGLEGWSIKDSSSEPLKPWGPGIAEVQDGALRFHTTGEVPPRFPEIVSETGFMIATLDRSAEDERFANGFLRSAVRANTASDANLLLRADAENLSGYLFTGIGPANEFQILRFENGDGELIGRLNGVNDPEFTLGDDWVIEAGAVGNELSMKVWRTGEQEPSEPQLVVYDDVLTSGQIGFAPAISTGLISDATRVDVTYDDILFRIAFDACDFDADGDCDLVDLDELQYVGLGGTESKYDLDGSGGTIDDDDTLAWLEMKDTVRGDADLDGDVDATDLNAVGIGWRSTNVASWSNGDFDGNGVVDALDLNLLGLNWRAGVAPAKSAVPEPAADCLLVVGLLMMVLSTRPR